MTGFISYEKQFTELLTRVMASPEVHAKWLNTLSYLENCGARKIAACEHPTLVKEEMLKHAAEEFRHALYLKRQIEKVTLQPMESYCSAFILGGASTLHYLSFLDLMTSRYLRSLGMNNQSVKEAAYLLVTYAIELRAGELYPLYDEALKKAGLKVSVKSILLEEKEHLNEMIDGLHQLSSGFVHAEKVCGFEAALCQRWLSSMMGVRPDTHHKL